MSDTVEELYSRLRAPLLRYCAGLTRERAAAEDLTQETFLRALANLETLEPLAPEQRQAWLYKTARNLFFDERRRYSRLTPPEEGAPEPEWDDDLSAVAVGALLETLPETERALFSLRTFAGYDSRELGELFSLPPSTVRARLASARRRLRAAAFDERKDG